MGPRASQPTTSTSACHDAVSRPAAAVAASVAENVAGTWSARAIRSASAFAVAESSAGARHALRQRRARPLRGGRARPVHGRSGAASPAYAGGGALALEAHRARRPRGQGTADHPQPAARGLHRPPLSGQRADVARPHPGGHARPDPRRREVRLAQGVPLQHLRDLVDPPVDRTRAREPLARHPAPGCRRSP